MSKRSAPKGLKAEGKRLWHDIAGNYELRFDEYRLLEEACREVDLIERLNADLEDAPLTAKGSMGQTVSAPNVQEVRQHRTVLARLLGQLKLPDADAGSGSTPKSRSGSARELAAARWGKRGA